MYKVHLFQYKSQFNTVFNVNPGNQDSPSPFLVFNHIIIVLYYLSQGAGIA
jgi:hypothetical protein